MDLPLNPRIAIVGAGAIGGFYGAKLARAGCDVHFLLRSDLAAVRQQGWIIQSIDGDFSLPPEKVQAYDDPLQMPQADLVIIALKTTANHVYQNLVGPLLGEHTAILTLQNGLGNEERLAELFGAHRVLGGLAFVCCNRVSPGVIRHMGFGQIRIGEFAAARSRRTEAICEMFRKANVPCEALDDLRTGRWEKLVWNVPFNGLGGLLDMDTAELLASQPGKEMVIELMQEVIRAAAAWQAKISQELIHRYLAVTATMGHYQTSMQIDRRLRRPMEVQAIIAAPLTAARSRNVATPRLAALYDLLCIVDAANVRETTPSAIS